MNETKEKIYRSSVLCLIGLALFSVGGVSGSYLTARAGQSAERAAVTQNEVHKQTHAFTFTNPLLSCDTIENISNQTVHHLRDQTKTTITNALRSGSINYGAVYFRDLNNGPWFGINEKADFTPGSLLKVPFMISLLKLAESDPSFLRRQVSYQKGGSEISQYFKPEEEMISGQVYSLQDLIERMIRYSDNRATLLLGQQVSLKELQKIYDELGITEPYNDTYRMSVRTYASFFRILFNATYLSQDRSEEALKLLSESTFSLGIHAGVPPEIMVAHKFGERSGEAGEDLQLHDCGIVYYPRYPYLLCVMTRGDNFSRLASVIHDISRIIYSSLKDTL